MPATQQHAEAHLVGKFVTVVYRIEDPTEWRKTNPLRYSHHGLEAYRVSIGDLAERRDALRDALQAIDRAPSYEAQSIARRALDADDATI